MTVSIPASQFVAVTPSVLSAGGSALNLNGLMLTSSLRVPMGTVLAFSTASAVSTYFGATSTEYTLAAIYFLGFDNSNKKPASLLIAQYNTAAVGAFLRGAAVSSLTLPQLQAISGTLVVTIDGVVKTAASLNLSAATSFSTAAAIIQTALGVLGPVGASVTGSIATTTLTVTAVASGTLAVGQTIAGTSVTAGTTITALLTGTGGTGTYTVSASQTVSSTTITATNPAVTYDSQSGAFQIISAQTGVASTIGYGSGTTAASLKLTSATGAVISQGAITAVPATYMEAIVAQTQAFASFMTAFDPDASGNTLKLAFAVWTNGKANRYAYHCWDTDITPTQSTSAPASLGQLLFAGNYTGTNVMYAPTLAASEAAFAMGAMASIDFDETAGRITFAYKGQSGLTPDVTDGTVATNLIANHYNFYGAASTANDTFRFFFPGTVSGDFDYLDSYANQIYYNNQFQLALMVLLTQAKAIPYNQYGYTLIRAGVLDVINGGVNFGAFVGGVTLSALQIAEVNASAGINIDKSLSQLGWFFQVQDATPQVRAARGSPPCKFWYMDGGSVHYINLASVEVQ